MSAFYQHSIYATTVNFTPRLPDQIEQTLTQHIKKTDPSPYQHTTTLDSIYNILHTFGYFQAQCRVDTSDTGDDATNSSVAIACNLNTPMTLTNSELVVQGSESKLLTSRLSKINQSLQLPTTFTTHIYETTKLQLLEEARSQGYIEAKAQESQLFLNIDQNTAKFQYVIDSGPLFTFGTISTQPNHYDPAYLASFAPFTHSASSPYSSSGISQFKKTLISTGLFQNVQVRPAAATSKHTVPITVEYTPINTWSQHLMLGFESNEHLIFLAETTRHHLNAKGASWNNALRLSKLKRSIATVLKFPRTHPRYDFWQYDLEAESNRIIPYGRSDRISANISLQKLNETSWQNVKLTQRLNCELTRSSDFVTANNLPWQVFIYPDIQASIQRILLPKLEMELTTSVSAGTTPLSPTRFLRNHTSWNLLGRISPNFRALTRTQLGFIFTNTPYSLPLDWYFLAGGMGSIRGFGFESLGNAILTENTHLFTVNVELQQEIITSLYLSAFVDNGSVGAQLSNYATSVGVGLVWESPLGNIECSVAKPVKNQLSSHSKPRIGIALRHSFF